MCWRQLHNVLGRKFIKSGAKRRLSLSFLASTVNDVTRKLYTVGTHLTVGKRAKITPDVTVETTGTKVSESILRETTVWNSDSI